VRFDDERDEVYFEQKRSRRVFDAALLREPLSVLTHRKPIILPPTASVSEGMRAMQRDDQGCVLITETGAPASPLLGIFTERDVLLRIIDRGHNPANLRLADVMTPDPEVLPVDARIAWALNKMCVGGFRHIPVVNGRGCPTLGVSVRDVGEFLVEAFPREVLNLPAEFDVPPPRTREGA